MKARLMRRAISTLVVAALSFVGASRAEATTISQVRTFTMYPEAPASTSADVAFSAFDPTLGTLTSVSLILEINLSYVVERPIGTTPQPAFYLEMSGSFDRGISTGAYGQLIRFPILDDVRSLDPFNPDLNEAGNGTFVMSFTLNAATDATDSPTPQVGSTSPGMSVLYGPLIGQRVDFTGGSVFEHLRMVPSDLDHFRGAEGSGSASLRYDYVPAATETSPVPEPSSLVLLTIGLGAGARRWFGRRRQESRTPGAHAR